MKKEKNIFSEKVYVFSHTSLSHQSIYDTIESEIMGPTSIFLVQKGHFSISALRDCHAWLSQRATQQNLGTSKIEIRAFLMQYFNKHAEIYLEAHVALIAAAALDGKVIKRELLHNEWAFFNILNTILCSLSKRCSCFHTFHQFKQECASIHFSTTKRDIAIKVSLCNAKLFVVRSSFKRFLSCCGHAGVRIVQSAGRP